MTFVCLSRPTTQQQRKYLQANWQAPHFGASIKRRERMQEIGKRDTHSKNAFMRQKIKGIWMGEGGVSVQFCMKLWFLYAANGAKFWAPFCVTAKMAANLQQQQQEQI